LAAAAGRTHQFSANGDRLGPQLATLGGFLILLSQMSVGAVLAAGGARYSLQTLELFGFIREHPGGALDRPRFSRPRPRKLFNCVHVIEPVFCLWVLLAPADSNLAVHE